MHYAVSQAERHFPCSGQLCCAAAQWLLLCPVLQGCGLQLEGVSRQKIVSAKISHLKLFISPPSFLLPLLSVAPAGMSLSLVDFCCVCVHFWYACRYIYCMYVCFVWVCIYARAAYLPISIRNCDLLWDSARSLLVTEVEVPEMLCTRHE